jgi:hypothetical protein
MSVVNLQSGGVTSKEWAWAKPEAGDVPVYLHPPHAMPIEWRNALEEAMQFANKPAEGHDEGMMLLALNERVEKLLAIPPETLEPTGLPKLPNPVVQHSQLGPLFDRLQMQFYAAKGMRILEDEVERLRGLKPELPPFPPSGSGLPRYGLRWNGPSEPLAVPMDDGYWTPWHLAEQQKPKPIPCGGCGESDPRKVCIGCGHRFYPT